MSEKEDIVRRFLIITVGSSASIHLLGSVARIYPEILLYNKIMIVETSKKVRDDAIDNLASIYHANYSESKGKKPEEQRFGFPTSNFKHELMENSILIASEGGGNVPDQGLGFFEDKRTDVINKITEIVKGEKEGKELSGILILGAAGKGTGTLVTPALSLEIMKQPSLPKPISLLTIPFRFEEGNILNAEKLIEYSYLEKVPLFLLDYERVVGSYLYQHKDIKERDIPTTELYNMVIDALRITLKNLIEALNFSTKCNPPLDWSDLMPIIQQGKVGTITYCYRRTKDEFIKYWKDDLAIQLLLRTKSKPKKTRAAIIVRGKDIPLGVDKELIKFHRKYFNAIANRYLLVRGEDFSIVSLVHGLDPKDITPPIKYGESVVERLLGI